MLHLLGLWWFLCLIKDGLKTLHQTALDSPIFWWWVALQQAQKLAGEPRCWDKVVGVILEVSGSRRHNLETQHNFPEDLLW